MFCRNDGSTNKKKPKNKRRQQGKARVEEKNMGNKIKRRAIYSRFGKWECKCKKKKQLKKEKEKLINMVCDEEII